ncbi:hypothetical protein C9374_004927 [Naegleria lovaniensis]|uniref:Uncharacterized protein n=1 Tax=Naegleria lovaniensis TaxID=51637 RepID=A0AA88GMC4_NAELO|nr:uncharacterized protein C9374_004927 [Naegleria lovaniensis]KAG2382960.1 hypothetical protein C9374_004927 [Naegleria lovaniensis]
MLKQQPKTSSDGTTTTPSSSTPSSSSTKQDSFFYTKQAIKSSTLPIVPDVLNSGIRIGGAIFGFVSGYYAFNNHFHQLFGVKLVEPSESSSPPKEWITKLIGNNNNHRKLWAKTSVGLISLATGGVFAVCSVPFVHFIAQLYYTCKITSYGLMKDVFDNRNNKNKENES